MIVLQSKFKWFCLKKLLKYVFWVGSYMRNVEGF